MALRSLKGFLSPVILKIAGQKLKEFARIRLYWNDLVGKNVAINAIPRSFQCGILKVSVKNSIWLQEMILYKHRIISDYRKYNLIIKDIVFFINNDQNYRRDRI